MTDTNYMNGAVFYENDPESIASGSAGNGVFYTANYSNLAVTAAGSMSLSVATGFCRVNNTLTGRATAASLTVSAANATYPRTDVVSINSSGTAAVTAGTAGPTAVPPVIPANQIILAFISVPAGVTTISSSMITDKRVFINNTPLRELYCDDTTSTSGSDSFETVKTTTLPAFSAPNGLLVFWNVLSTGMTSGSGTNLGAQGRVSVAGSVLRTSDSLFHTTGAAYAPKYWGENFTTPALETTNYGGTGTVVVLIQILKTDNGGDLVAGAACSQFVVLGW